MESIENKLCRLCLQTCNGNFETIKETHQQSMNLILLNLNLTITLEPVMCTNCGEILRKCSSFKRTFLQVEDSVVSFARKQYNNEEDLGKFSDKFLPENCSLCRFCMNARKYGSFISLNDEQLDILLTKAMLQQYFPEMDLNATKEPAICTWCYEFLQRYFNFVINCLTVENKIQKYCETKEANTAGPVELSKIVCFASQSVLKDKDQHSTLSATKVKNDRCEEEQDKVHGVCDEEGHYNGKVEIKEENLRAEGERYKKVGESDVCIEVKSENIPTTDNELFEETGSCYVEADIKSEKVADAAENQYEDDEINKEIYEWNKSIEMDSESSQLSAAIFQQDVNALETNTYITQTAIDNKCDTYALEAIPNDNLNCETVSATSKELYKCLICPYQTDYKYRLARHMLIHKSISEVKMYKCERHDYQTELNSDLRNHMLRYKTNSELAMYLCELCAYQTKYEDCLQRHMRRHRRTSKLMHKCDICTYETRYKSSFLEHSLGHSNNSRVNNYKCGTCRYQTTTQSRLKRHMACHKNTSDITMYNCETCGFQTKYKSNLPQHFLSHKNTADVSGTCNTSGDSAKHTCGQKLHLPSDRYASEVRALKCKMCSFKTKYHYSLQRHMVIHKATSEITMHKCKNCKFQSRYKESLQKHILVHKDMSEITMYKCETCEFQTKYKSRIQKHGLTHMVYECNLCEFSTKQLDDLQAHAHAHKDSSSINKGVQQENQTSSSQDDVVLLRQNTGPDAPIFKCAVCSYKTRYKKHLKPHMLTHKNTLEVTMYKCETCDFQSKHKRNVQKHMVTHKSTTEVTMYKCENCAFQTKYESCIQRHNRRPQACKRFTDAATHQCEMCSYQTVYEKVFQQHVLSHESIVKIQEKAGC